MLKSIFAQWEHHFLTFTYINFVEYTKEDMASIVPVYSKVEMAPISQYGVYALLQDENMKHRRIEFSIEPAIPFRHNRIPRAYIDASFNCKKGNRNAFLSLHFLCFYFSFPGTLSSQEKGEVLQEKGESLQEKSSTSQDQPHLRRSAPEPKIADKPSSKLRTSMVCFFFPSCWCSNTKIQCHCATVFWKKKKKCHYKSQPFMHTLLISSTIASFWQDCTPKYSSFASRGNKCSKWWIATCMFCPLFTQIFLWYF